MQFYDAIRFLTLKINIDTWNSFHHSWFPDKRKSMRRTNSGWVSKMLFLESDFSSRYWKYRMTPTLYTTMRRLTMGHMWIYTIAVVRIIRRQSNLTTFSSVSENLINVFQKFLRPLYDREKLKCKCDTPIGFKEIKHHINRLESERHTITIMWRDFCASWARDDQIKFASTIHKVTRSLLLFIKF